MASNGPPDDFHNQRTQFANYGGPGGPPRPGESPPPADLPPDQAEAPEAVEEPDPFDQEREPTPWYRKPLGVIAWVIAVAILLALIVYGLMELIQGGQGTSHTPSTTSSTTPATTTMTTTPTTTTPSETPPSSASEPPAQQPTQQPTHQPTQQQPTHRHHMPQLPSVITIPDGPVVTLPRGLP